MILVILSPEHLETWKPHLKKLYGKEMIGTFVIDEAHCVSVWGRTFRKKYLLLALLKSDDLLKTVPMLVCLTLFCCVCMPKSRNVLKCYISLRQMTLVASFLKR